MAIIDSKSVCGILVATENGNPAKVRVGDLENLKPQETNYPVGYDEFDVASEKYHGSHVMIVKGGQKAVVEGNLKLRFFVKMWLSTDDSAAKTLGDLAWEFRKPVIGRRGPLWHEYFTKKRR